MNTLPIMIAEDVIALKELGIWKYMSKDERKAFRNSTTIAELSRLSRTYRDKYYDIMYADYEKATKPKTSVKGADVLIVDAELSTRATNALIRSHIESLQGFADYVAKHGWSKIKNFGRGSAEEVFARLKNINRNNMTDAQRDKLLSLVIQFEDIEKNASKYQM